MSKNQNANRWHVVPERGGLNNFGIYDRYGVRVAAVSGWKNADLMACAPEMHRALRDLLQHVMTSATSPQYGEIEAVAALVERAAPQQAQAKEGGS